MTELIRNPEDLNRLRDKARAAIDLRAAARDLRVTVHMGTCGIAAGARDVLAGLATELGRAKAQNVTLKQAGCAGLCEQEPMITVTEKGGREYRYGRLDTARVREIVDQHLVGGNPVATLLINS